jgi:FtsP/CotA-like multicopper oxidase with cupredoxin domain
MAMTDLNRSAYSGEFGFLVVDPAAGDAGRYDREVVLAAHHWEGSWVSMQDMKKGPPPDNGLEAMYKSATLGDRMLGHGEPIRVRQGERVLFRLLNASGSMGISLALSGHRFIVITLDGNPVPTQASVDALKLDVAERADVIVEMNNPGIWVFGSTDDDDRNMGMGVVVEYENRSGEPRWAPPPKAKWDYTAFGGSGAAAAPDPAARRSLVADSLLLDLAAAVKNGREHARLLGDLRAPCRAFGNEISRGCVSSIGIGEKSFGGVGGPRGRTPPARGLSH